MRFEKWQALGNDYLILEQAQLPVELTAARVRLLCDLFYRLLAAYRYRLLGKAVAAGECDGGTCALHFRPAARSPEARG